ncbi:MAG: glutathione S-transferase family protein [Solirubrobacteraceae bacterium]
MSPPRPRPNRAPALRRLGWARLAMCVRDGPWSGRCDTRTRPVLRLYYMPRTRSSRVLWLLAEIDATCELVKLAPQERRSAEHLARHPLGRVPALELDDGTVMFESAAICLQLADLHPEAELIAPLGSSSRALVYQWVLFAMTELEAPLFRWIRDVAEDSGDSSARDRFAQAAAALESALDGRQWLLGDRFTVADVMCASVLGGAHSRGLLTQWPGLQAYVERGEARPAFIQAAAISNQPRG